MNGRGECRPQRKADRVAESLARELEEARLASEAHVAALEILRDRLARVEALAAWFESQHNWREWGIHRQIRAALAGPANPQPPTRTEAMDGDREVWF
jgi:hypothetical protein